MSQPPSTTGKLKRDIAVYGVALVGVGIIMDFALPWFNFLQTIGSVLGLAADYPKAAAIPVAFLILIFIMAAVDDRFSG